MKLFDADATRAPLRDMPRLVATLRQAFSDGATVPPRHVHDLHGVGKGTVLIMPAWNAAGLLGIKTINVFPDNAARGLPALHASYVLYDAATGVPLALMDGNELTAHRTVAAAALAASHLAQPDASRLLVLGAGRIARLLPAAFAAVRPVRQVAVWNHHAAAAERLAAMWREAGLDAVAVPEERLEHAVRNAHIVSCATLATSPLVRGEWLAPGSHLDLIGSFTPLMTEADAACFAGARVFVDTEEALLKAGELLDAMSAGTFTAQQVQGTLAQLCRAERPGRVDAQERTVFKAVGTALEDLAAASLVWHSAVQTRPG